MGVLSAVVRTFNEIAMQAGTPASNRLAKANRASHSPRVSPRTQAKVIVKKIRENPKENPKEPMVSKAHARVKTSKTGISGLENLKSETSSDTQESVQTYTMVTIWNDGWNGDEWNDGGSFDEWNDDWSSVGWHEGWEQTYDTSASSFSLGILDLEEN